MHKLLLYVTVLEIEKEDLVSLGKKAERLQPKSRSKTRRLNKNRTE